MAPPLALGEVPEEVRMDKLLGMNAPPAEKIYNEKDRYHVEWKDLHMSQEEQDRIAYLRERGAKHVFTPYELEVRSLRSRDLEAYKKPTPLTAQFDRECRYDFQQQGLSFDPRVSTKQSFCSKCFDWWCCSVWKSTSASGAPDNSSLSHFSAMTRPSWLGRAARNRHRHAIEQASRRWRGGRRDDSARTRRKI